MHALAVVGVTKLTQSLEQFNLLTWLGCAASFSVKLKLMVAHKILL